MFIFHVIQLNWTMSNTRQVRQNVCKCWSIGVIDSDEIGAAVDQLFGGHVLRAGIRLVARSQQGALLPKHLPQPFWAVPDRTIRFGCNVSRNDKTMPISLINFCLMDGTKQEATARVPARTKPQLGQQRLFFLQQFFPAISKTTQTSTVFSVATSTRTVASFQNCIAASYFADGAAARVCGSTRKQSIERDQSLVPSPVVQSVQLPFAFFIWRYYV